jgi:hypothetical protein
LKINHLATLNSAGLRADHQPFPVGILCMRRTRRRRDIKLIFKDCERFMMLLHMKKMTRAAPQRLQFIANNPFSNCSFKIATSNIYGQQYKDLFTHAHRNHSRQT